MLQKHVMNSLEPFFKIRQPTNRLRPVSLAPPGRSRHLSPEASKAPVFGADAEPFVFWFEGEMGRDGAGHGRTKKKTLLVVLKISSSLWFLRFRIFGRSERVDALIFAWSLNLD